MLEDTPSHVYFILATTDHTKILSTIRTRCTEVKLKALGEAEIHAIIESVLEQSGNTLATGSVADKIIENANGSARQALVMLNTVIGLDAEDQLDGIAPNDLEIKAFDLAKALLWEKPDPAKTMKLVAGLADEDPEGIRHLILKCLIKEFMKGRKQARTALVVFDRFSKNFYDTKYAGLVAAVADVVYGD